jgi:peroxiredoxin
MRHSMSAKAGEEAIPEQMPAIIDIGSGSFGDESSVGSRQGPVDLKVLKRARLFPISFDFNEVSVDHTFKESLRSIVRMECDKAKAKVLILYAARHPAAGCCRREGRAMANLAAKFSDVAFVTAVKDSTEIHESLAEFHDQYSCQSPIYQDPTMGIFKAFGSRKIRFWPLVRGTTKLMVRARKLGITINYAQLQKSEMWTQGGVLVFRNTGTLFYSVSEPSVGTSFDMVELERIVERCRQSCNKRGSSSHTTNDAPIR